MVSGHFQQDGEQLSVEVPFGRTLSLYSSESIVMQKLALAAVAALLFSIPVGCEKESSVVEAPPVSEESSMRWKKL